MLACGEVLLSPERVGQELEGQVLSVSWCGSQNTGATLADHSSIFARDVLERMVVASQQVRWRHAGCQMENVKDNNAYSRKKLD